MFRCSRKYVHHYSLLDCFYFVLGCDWGNSSSGNAISSHFSFEDSIKTVCQTRILCPPYDEFNKVINFVPIKFEIPKADVFVDFLWIVWKNVGR